MPRCFLASAWVVALLFYNVIAGIGLAQAQETVRIGLIHHFTGPLAAFDAPMPDMLNMLIEEQNAAGGLLGRKLEPVWFDAAGKVENYPLGAKHLISEQGAAIIMTSASDTTCKEIAPVAQELNAILFCAGENVGGETLPNVVRLGLTPAQRALPAVEFLKENDKIDRWMLVGTESAFSVKTNSIIEEYLKANGVEQGSIVTSYGSQNSTDWNGIAAQSKEFADSGDNVTVVSTLTGGSVPALTDALSKYEVQSSNVPVVDLASQMGWNGAVVGKGMGGIEVASYFSSLDTPANRDLKRRWQAYKGDNPPPITETMAAEAIGFAMWVEAVKKSGTFETAKVLEALVGISVPGFAGSDVKMLPDYTLGQPVLLARYQPDSGLVVEATTPRLDGDNWGANFDPGGVLVSDWASNVMACVEFDTAAGKCKENFADRSKRTVDLLFATTRDVKQDATGGVILGTGRSSLSFGGATITVPNKHTFGQVDRRSLFEWATFNSISETEFQLQEKKALTRDEFTSLIKNVDSTDAIVFVHGFKNTFEDSAFRLAQIVWDTEYRGVPILFSWPSKGTIPEYVTDSDSAEYSAAAFRELLRTLKKDAGVKTVHVIAHSMGARVVVNAATRSEPVLDAKPIQELILAAPDIDRDTFAQEAPSIVAFASGITLYANKNDWALFLSKQLRSQFMRAGDASPPLGPLVLPGIDTIDVSAIGEDFFSFNHSTFAESMMAMQELASVIAKGTRPPNLRTYILVGMPDGSSSPTYWRFPD